MGDGLRTLHVVSSDESLLASTSAAADSLDGWEVAQIATQEELLEHPPALGDVLLVDAWLRGRNVYEFCRTLTGQTRCRTFLVVDQGNDLAGPIARFCGASGVLRRPLSRSTLTEALQDGAFPRGPLPHEGREGGDQAGAERADALDLPASLLRDINTGQPDTSLVHALIDPETGLFNYGFLNIKLDEEFKRAKRFDQPLACVMLGFEGQATSEVLRELSSIFLETSRDTDLLGRFDENSFLFLLPNTGPDGASIMASRVTAMAAERNLRDLVGDALVLSVGISSYPHPDFAEREDLYGSARKAFFDARAEGGGVICV